jgi:quinol monooxygenase YgiN
VETQRQEADMTVIIAGRMYVDPDERDRFIEGYRVLVERARAYPGCIDVSFSPDCVEPGRVNMFECWESAEVLDRWRARAPRPGRKVKVRDLRVSRYDAGDARPPFD